MKILRILYGVHNIHIYVISSMNLPAQEKKKGILVVNHWRYDLVSRSEVLWVLLMLLTRKVMCLVYHARRDRMVHKWVDTIMVNVCYIVSQMMSKTILMKYTAFRRSWPYLLPYTSIKEKTRWRKWKWEEAEKTMSRISLELTALMAICHVTRTTNCMCKRKKQFAQRRN